jgi:hypothetical protein
MKNLRQERFRLNKLFRNGVYRVETRKEAV